MPLQDVELDAVARAACRAADALDAKLITCVTRSGQLAKAVARHRPSIPIVAFCYTAEVGRSLALHRAVTPILLDAGAELCGNQPVCRLHAIEQASRRWRAGRRDDSARTRRKI